MANYKRVRKYDVTFIAGESSSSNLTSHINNRIGTLQSSVGGSEYFDALNVDLKYLNKAQPNKFKSSETITNVIVEKETQLQYTLQNGPNTGTYTDTIVPPKKENIVTSYEKTVTPALNDGVSETDLTMWILMIEYDQTVAI